MLQHLLVGIGSAPAAGADVDGMWVSVHPWDGGAVGGGQEVLGGDGAECSGAVL